MHIVFAASEGVPFSKTGGLADVVGALPRTLASAGHQVSVYLPLYRQTLLRKAEKVVSSITIPFDDRYRFCSVASAGKSSGVQFYFVDYPPFFGRDALYGTSSGDYPDNAERFALFSRAVLEASKILGPPQIFHCHDWQAALIPVLLRTQYAEDPAFRDAATVFTIHNMGYQGLFPPDTLPLLTLPWDLFTISKMEFFGNVNFLKGALVFSDFITTVSKKYSQEIQTTEFGFGLEGVLRTRSSTVTGILNGVDYDEWSPETDKFTIARYSAQDLSGKTKCREDLLASFDIPKADARLPVIGIVSRFAAQKGFDLIAQIMERLAREEMIIVALGSGDKTYEEMFLRLSKQFPQKIAVKVAYRSQPTTARRGVPSEVGATSACNSTSTGRVPSMPANTAVPGLPRSRSERNNSEGLETSRRPKPVISNTPISSVGPIGSSTARRMRNCCEPSPSNDSTASTMCSTTRGPAIWPSLVTWPTRMIAAPDFLANRISACAEAPTWVTVPGADSTVSVHMVWIESITISRGTVPSDRVETMSSTEVSAASCTGASARPRRSARNRTCATASSPEM